MEDVARYEKLASDLYVHGSVSLALSMAKDTGMVNCLCAADQPLTSSDVASQLKLKERYVRETLNSLTVAGLVKLEEGTGGKEGKEAKFSVPTSCRQMLQKAASNCNIVALNARNYVNVRKIFDLDGPYSVRYQAATFSVMDERVHLRLDIMVDALLKTPGLRQRLEQGIQAMDVGCGTGRLSMHLAAMFPASRFTLSDLMPQPLEVARQQAEKDGLTNVTFRVMDICQVPEDLAGSLDWVMCRNVIHDLPYPSKALEQICKILKPGGQFSMMDAFVSSYVAENVKGFPVTAAMYADSMFNCIPESYQQVDSEALGNCWGMEKATEMVEAAGMKVLGVTRLEEKFRYPGVCVCLKPE